MKGFPIEAAQKTLTSFYQLQRAAQVSQIDALRRRIVEFHSVHNPLYKKLLNGKLITEWEALPIVSKQDLQVPISSMVSEQFAHRDMYVGNTSGSSGHPFYFAKDKFCHALTWSFILMNYRSLGIGSSDRQARFYGIPLDMLSNIKEKIKDTVMHRVRFPVFNMGEQKLENFLQKFRKIKIDYIYGYTNSILLFSEYLIRRNIVLKEVCPNLKICIVTSEVCRDEDKIVIESALGVRVIREYGASELDIIAIEGLDGRWPINEANLYVEVVSEENKVLPMGKEGRLIITSLHNQAAPFIRYDIGDIGILEQDDKSLVLKRLLGRGNDTVLLPSGKKSPGLTFYYISRSVLESSGILKEFIIRQTALDCFEFDVISDRSLTKDEENNIQRKMDQYLEPGLNLKINRVEEIVRPVSGKIKHFYSELTR